MATGVRRKGWYAKVMEKGMLEMKERELHPGDHESWRQNARVSGARAVVLHVKQLLVSIRCDYSV